MNKLIYCFLLSLIIANSSNAQSLTLRNFGEDNNLLDRYEIMNGKLHANFETSNKNISAKTAVDFLQNADIKDLSSVDEMNISTLLSKNHEWCDSLEIVPVSKKPIFKYFYKTPSDFFEAKKGNEYFVAINPIIYYQQGKEKSDGNNEFVNKRGFEVKGIVNKKLSFYTQLTDNQETMPTYMRAWRDAHEAMPSAGYYKNFKANGNDYTLATGYINFEAMKNKIDISFGHDKFFIGDGYRSLFLSNDGNENLFLKLHAKFWKINYQTIFSELTPAYTRGGDQLLPRKYTAMHHLTMNVKPWLNIGAFEAIVFSRKDHFEFQYLNPVIFYRTLEQMNGSPDNALLGFDTKIIPAKNVEIYGQLLLDEFNFSHVIKADKWMANKQAYQIGLKYINALGIKNLDVQIERNHIRPYTYSYHDSLAEYSNYNQPLAHPNGANLVEHIFVVRYQPIAKLFLSVETILRKQGIDSSASSNVGSNIFSNYTVNVKDLGNVMYNGIPQTTVYVNANASFQLKHNLFIDAGYTIRNQKATSITTETKSNYLYAGFRLNSVRRKYNY